MLDRVQLMTPPPSLSAPFTIAFGGHTDVGKRRQNNEDSLQCGPIGAGTPNEGTLLAVSDGVGGLKAGEIASRLAVAGLPAVLSQRLAAEAVPPDRRSWLDEAIREVDRRIRLAAAAPDLSGMGATLSVVWIEGKEAWWGQAGDSRTYLFRKKNLRQLSRDQSPIGRLRAEEKITEEQARNHPLRHLIDGCLGGGSSPVEPQTGALEIAVGDVFLLCSDGLSDGLWDGEIAEELALAGHRPPEATARALVNRANEASGKDNITAVIACVAGAPGAATETRTAAGFISRLIARGTGHR